MHDNSGLTHPPLSSMPILEQIKTWARRLKLEIATLYFVCRHRGTPWPVKLLGVLVVAYALSPVDLIPDFIPVLGFLDEAILLPALIWLGVRLTPAPVLAECRAKAHERDAARSRLPRSYAGAAAIVLVWAGAAYGVWWWWKG
jgi:uncharacterized membrane protein YkvA (DUF1232 family)